MTLPDLMNLILLFLAVVFIGILWSNKTANFIDLITAKNGKMSGPKVMELGAFVVSTWGLVVLINKDRLTEWYFIGYLTAFVIRSSWSAWLGSRQDPPPAAAGGTKT